MSCLRTGPARAAAAAALLGVLLAPAGAPAQNGRGKINGMTVSTPRGSAEWGRDNMVPTITDLRSLGVNWIAIHPYAGIDRDGTVRWRRGEGPDEAPEWLTRPIREAHRQGVKIFVKPHLAYWGRFSWRGEIEFASAEEWQRFFTTYRQWIEAMARFSAGADAFAVGTELDRTVHRPEWRAVIEDVRQAYSGPLTYAANWTDFERVPFWDALDAIGIQAYFPLLEQGTMAEGQLPTRNELEAGWEAIMARMREFGSRYGKTVVFTELGYNNSWRAATEPWDARTSPDPAAAELQRLCMEVALEAIAREPAVVGAFLWKWFPGDRVPRDFAMSSPAMREVIGSRWSIPDGR
jgi:hypothetical protein